MSIPRCSADAQAAEVAEVLDEAGCVVITGLLGADKRKAIRDELDPHMAKARIVEDDDPTQFYPGHTRRVTALVTRSPTVTDNLLVHPVSKQLCDAFLLPNSEFGYQVHVTAALEVGPGARAQELHREEGSFTFFPVPRPNLIVASMWAVTEFRKDNGATLLVPGSHRWPAERNAEPHEIIQAEMPAGSVLYWLGGTLHGAGPNTSQDWRYGVILTYSLGWLRQEENQYLHIPPERLAELSPEVRRVAGFEMYEALGLFDPSAARR